MYCVLQPLTIGAANLFSKLRWTWGMVDGVTTLRLSRLILAAVTCTSAACQTVNLLPIGRARFVPQVSHARSHALNDVATDIESNTGGRFERAALTFGFWLRAASRTLWSSGRKTATRTLCASS